MNSSEVGHIPFFIIHFEPTNNIEIDEPENAPEAPVFEPVDEPENAPEAPVQEETTDAPAQEAPAQQDEPIFVDGEADQEPQDISTDTNGVVADNIGNITNDILGGVSYSIKTALEKELGTETNDSATNGLVNDVVVDLLNQSSDEIKNAVGSILENDIENADFQAIASEAAGKVAEVLGNKVVTAIASNIDINLDYENVAKNVITNTVESVEGFVKKNLETSKAVVDQTLTNESSDDLAISNANDIATMVTNGVSYLLKSTLCESLESDKYEKCDNLVNTLIVNAAGILNEIITSNVKAATTGNGLQVACSAIPGNVFEKLTGTVVGAISSQIGNDSAEAEGVSKIANNILTVIINSIEDLLCANRTDADEAGSVILKDITGLATHIINKVNSINDNVVSTINEEKEEDNSISGSIASGINEIQETLKDEVEGGAEQPAEAQEEQPVETQQEQPAEAQQEQPAEAQQEQPAEAQQEQPAEAQQEQPAEAQQEQPAEAQEQQDDFANIPEAEEAEDEDEEPAEF
ncbi:hypothetical protein PIROE2DRAFT_69161 [Piromyces sp. E2]|nr:hypothetical protein PIROE2DRAFT_69161 [Piromyces sp. E2]|eukprot:OUM64934.1 hypothetical protein PIROE2DRAFT_69161 [Piromyces sp. E2]